MATVGTRALLLTDVVDSTKLVEGLGDAEAARIWAAHDRVARDLLPTHNGREIDKTDGFLLLFDTVADAVAYALDYHRALGRLSPPLRARAGLHHGAVVLTENRAADVARGAKPLEVDGLAKPLAARVMGLAGGGQTLLTEAALDALGPTPHRVVAHGHYRVKGVSAPLALFEIGGPEAPFSPPPDAPKAWRVVRAASGGAEAWVPAREVPHHLPAERDTFVGRVADLDAVARRFDEGARLVTLLGMGGTGKTRLALRHAWGWLGDWPGGAWFCDLSEARDEAGILASVASTLGLPPTRGELGEAVAVAVRDRGPCLVILDNFEQVARHASRTVGAWLARAPEARFLVTTREILGVQGETAIALAPLETADAVALFATRAAQARQEFVLTPELRPEVEALVELLDRLPLAIELAAARVRAMSPRVMIERMRERFRLLSTPGARHTRQATLKGTLDWSWELLSADEQATLAQLSVFEGGFTLEAAEAVLSLDGTWAADAVQSLVDKSLLRSGDDRFGFLYSVHEYAWDRLVEGRTEAEARHGAWFARLAPPERLREIRTWDADTRLRRLTADRDNLATAARRAAARGDGDTAGRCAFGLWQALALSGPYSTAAEVAGAVRDVVGPGVLRVELDACSVICLAALGRLAEARALGEAALAEARGLDRRRQGRASFALASALRDLGEYEAAVPLFEAAIAAAAEVGDEVLACDAESGLGIVGVYTRRNEEARGHLERALALARRIGDQRTEANNLANLAVLCRNLADDERAQALFEEALEKHRRVGNRRSEAVVLANLGQIQRERGELEAALRTLLAALDAWRALGGGAPQTTAEIKLANCLGSLGRRAEAGEHFAAALDAARRTGERRPLVLALSAMGHFLLTSGDIDAAEAHFVEVAPTFTHDAVVLSEARAGLARVALRRREHAAARAHAFPDPMEAETWLDLALVRAELRALDGAPEEARHWLGRAHPRGLIPEDLALHAAVSAVVVAAEGGDPEPHLRDMEARAPDGWLGPGSELGAIAARARAVHGAGGG